jgi:hypothetical protein
MLFAKISFTAIEHIGNAEALAVYVSLMRYAKFTGQDVGPPYTTGVWVSDEQLARMLGIDETAVINAKELLHKKGWLADSSDQMKHVVVK